MTIYINKTVTIKELIDSGIKEPYTEENGFSDDSYNNAYGIVKARYMNNECIQVTVINKTLIVKEEIQSVLFVSLLLKSI